MEEGIPAAAGAGVEVKLLGTVVGQPGPPLLLYDLPLAAPAEAPAGEPAATGAGPERTPFPLGDAEIDRILSDRDLEVEHGDKDRR